MIPVTPSEEPANFDSRVRQRGNAWLRDHAKAEVEKFPSYWNDVRLELQRVFRSRCGYLGHWIPRGHVDHFVAKAVDPSLTYEWSNYRYADEFINVRKGTKSFLDPFTIAADWIRIDPVTLNFIIAGNIPASLMPAARTTVAVLNDPELVAGRLEMLAGYRGLDGRSVYDHLACFFPLLGQCMREAGLFEPEVPAIIAG